MDLRLEGLKVVVTGASKGIGFACAKRFADEGALVVMCARDASALESARQGLGRNGVSVVAADLSNAQGRQLLFDHAADADILVNNAGAIRGGDLLKLSIEEIEQDWQLKLFGYMHLTQLYLRQMQRRGSGTILNIIGMASRSPRWSYVSGAAANAALVSFTAAVGGESPRWGVRVLGLNPGITRTERYTRLRAERGGFNGPGEEQPLEPEQIADVCALLGSPISSAISGVVVDADGGAQHRKPPG